MCYFHLTSFFLHFCKCGMINEIHENYHCSFSRNIRGTNGFCLFHFRTTRQQQHVPGSLEVSSFKAKFSRETEVWTSNYLRGRPSNLHGNERDQSRLDQKLLANSTIARTSIMMMVPNLCASACNLSYRQQHQLDENDQCFSNSKVPTIVPTTSFLC